MDDFTEYVTARAGWLRKVAYLLCGDWHRADDLVQTAITRLYANWPRASRAGNLDGYARRTLVNTFLAEQRTSWWRRVDLRGAEHERPMPGSDVEGALDLRAALDRLPGRQRATVVLRYFCDLPVAETARALGCSEGTVKSQTSKAVDALRELLGEPIREGRA
ncbi:SigE family RNA polymerase sigma factor [Amycolatopsis sp. SID8362]|uniref:SigE family RNA polymerase sigma factor n=1 Tax=Amycolatopsis sp. SID8362 TaxID=2690346 RepID=UPI0013705F7F|nr:SigE family RNA polymerase sigma factor [Amycolatopsis sp. SID8362]NBH03926.1 SigE family RNA polymerase sigma factor [Amycolatopsis sp. SID8362]NED40626.1 SigE family RNA polymerase sigma factor [Amycolatopsis sp. SID8362]